MQGFRHCLCTLIPVIGPRLLLGYYSLSCTRDTSSLVLLSKDCVGLPNYLLIHLFCLQCLVAQSHISWYSDTWHQDTPHQIGPDPRDQHISRHSQCGALISNLNNYNNLRIILLLVSSLSAPPFPCETMWPYLEFMLKYPNIEVSKVINKY